MPRKALLPAPTARIEFRRWSAQDHGRAFALWGDFKVSRFVGGPFTEQQVLARLSRHIRYGREYGFQYWPLFLHSGGDFIGCCGLKPCDYGETRIEHGFYLRPQFHGQGLGYEAAQNVLTHAFETLRTGSIFAGHHPQNEASRALLMKLGFEYAFDEFYEPTGVNHPGYLLKAQRWDAIGDQREQE
jgi:RimJ/RimL family protein N-acetyltransferase